MNTGFGSTDIALPWGAWYSETSLQLSLPHSWSVEVLPYTQQPGCSHRRMEQALEDLLGFPSLPEWCSGGGQVAIAVDDVARPTQAAPLLDLLLDRLATHGIAGSQVSVVIGGGTHSPPDALRIAAKLGPRVCRECRIEVHDPHGDLAETGLPYGDRTLRLNRTFLEASLKICVGSVLPHPFAGYGGGAKMLVPGLSDVPTTDRTHKFVLLGLRGGTNPRYNRFRTEIEQLVQPLGPVLAVQCVPNVRRETCAVFAGDLVAAHRAACDFAAQTYATPIAGEYDGLILNAYPKDVDLLQSQGALVALKTLARSPLREEGVAVLTTAASNGVGVHELFGPGGLSQGPPKPLREFRGRELWVLAPGLMPADLRWYFHESVRFFDDPVTLVAALQDRLGPRARVGIALSAPLQQFVEAN
ncbi:MAG: lactate racemase domain-containing protein [Planctomycetaceae bacterium]|jgi:nickel-dependent lactate racemase